MSLIGDEKGSVMDLPHVLIEIRQGAGLLAATLTAFAVAALRSGAHRSVVALLLFLAGTALTVAILGTAA